MYSTRLDTPLIRNKVPLKPTDAPVRVVVLSPFGRNETAARKTKIAITKTVYVIEPEKNFRCAPFLAKNVKSTHGPHHYRYRNTATVAFWRSF
jgi:hypothetical protein